MYSLFQEQQLKKIKAKQKRLQIILGEEISGGIDDGGFEEDGGEQINIWVMLM